MTRENALKRINAVKGNDYTKKVVNSIYDDFESRICASCNHLEDHGFGWLDCKMLGKMYEDIGFGCNQWRDKDAKEEE